MRLLHTDAFGDTSPSQSYHECPVLPFEALDELEPETNAKEDAEEPTGSKAGIEAIDGEFDRASLADVGTIMCRKFCRWEHSWLRSLRLTHGCNGRERYHSGNNEIKSAG